MTKDLDYAIRVIKSTIQDHSPEVFYPYFFIVGAGISAPEIPIASEIIKKCKRKCKELDEMVNLTTEETKDLTKWWGDASIVGEYESKLVLALIHEKELP